MDKFIPTYISTNTTTTIGTGPQTLGAILITETAAGAITVKNGTATIAVFKASIAEGRYEFNCEVPAGLSIVTAAASKVTVLSRPSS